MGVLSSEGPIRAEFMPLILYTHLTLQARFLAKILSDKHKVIFW